MSSGLFPEKFAMYFATMNPLSAKIYSDIQRIEESLKFAPNTSYSEKCAILDKHLIHDVIKNNKLGHHNNRSELSLDLVEEKEMVFFDDPVLDQDQVAALLLSVYPKKPEKYVYDDNSFWLDEHSESYSCCTQNQANICKLGQLVKSLPLSLAKSGSRLKFPQDIRLLNNIRKQSVESESDSDSNPEEVYEAAGSQRGQLYHKPALLGVPVMGLMGQVCKTEQFREDRSGSIKNKRIIPSSEIVEESNLPQQKQNLDLIAELQAKLKSNKAKADAPQPPKKTIVQVNKPKAPPPPPPKIPIPGMAVKVTVPIPDHDQFEEKGKTNSKLDKVIQGKPTASTEPQSVEIGTGSNEKQKTSEDFVVDVSSPCRIATPKTGFDFLDNW